MLINIRHGVFETNSSSTHSMIICSDEQYKKLEEGELYIDWDDKLRTLEEIKEEYANMDAQEKELYKNFVGFKECNFHSLRSWLDEMSECHKTYTTPSGEKVHAFSKYGYEG